MKIMMIKLFIDIASLSSIKNGTDFGALYKPTEQCNIEIQVDVNRIVEISDEFNGVWVRPH